METKANYVLIGLFTILGLLGILAFFLWFARIELDRQFAYYDVRFDSVAGLSAASDVRFSGLPVGQVVDVRLSPSRDGTITVRLEVAADTPVREDSIATIESQGVTGVSFVAIDPGTPSAPFLEAGPGDPVPQLQPGRSTIQALTEDAPELITETLRVVREIGDLFGGENEGRLERILINTEEASEGFASTLAGFAGIAETVEQFAAQISLFNETLDSLTSELEVVFLTADEAFATISTLAQETRSTVVSGGEALEAVEQAAAEFDRYLAEDLTGVATEVQETLDTLRSEVVTLREDASAMIDTFATTGLTATARLEEAETLIAEANTLLASLDEASVAVEDAASQLGALIEEGGVPLVAEARVAVAEATDAVRAVGNVAETDLPGIVANIRGAVDTATATFDRLATDLGEAGAGVSTLVANAEVTLVQVTETFASANETLGAIAAALETGERALVAAEGAFTGAATLIDNDITEVVEDLEGTLAELNTAIGTVSEDLPEISAELRAASSAAADAFGELQSVVGAAEPGVREFTTATLPLFSRLAQETRTLVGNLDRLTQQIGRDPARFLLGQDVPEFRR